MSSGKIVRDFLTGLWSLREEPNLRYYTYVCLETVIKMTRIFSHVIVCPGWDSKVDPPEYKLDI